MSAALAQDEFTTMETREASPTHFLIKFESFYNSGIDKYQTGVFMSGEYKWRLIIYPNGHNNVGKDGDYISVYLAMAETNSLPANWEVNAVFNIFLFNQISGNYICSLGRTRRFRTIKSEWGFPKFISKKIMCEPSNGYLINDNCVFGAEVFIVKQEAVVEWYNFDIPYKCDWYIPNFSKLQVSILKSEEFTAGGHKWELRLYPKGNKEGAGTHVSIYLYYGGSEKVQTCFTVWLKNQVSDKHEKRTTTHCFPSKSDWGWQSFVELATINDPKKGFIVNDSCLLHLEISSVKADAQ